MAGGPTSSVYIYITSLKTDIFGSEKWWLEDENSFWNGSFSGDMVMFGGVILVGGWATVHLKTYSSKWVRNIFFEGVELQQQNIRSILTYNMLSLRRPYFLRGIGRAPLDSLEKCQPFGTSSPSVFKFIHWLNLGFVCLFDGWKKESKQNNNSLKLNSKSPWKMMVGILLSYWGGLFSGAMLVSGSVIPWAYCNAANCLGKKKHL